MRILFSTIFSLLVVSGCEQQPVDYFPLVENEMYEYFILQTVNDQKHQAKLIIANLPVIKNAGENIYPRVTASGATLYYQKKPEGIFYTSDLGVAGNMVLKYPLQQNASWRSASDIYVLKSRHESFAGGESFISLGGALSLTYRITGLQDVVHVRAGSFTNCVRVEASGTMPVAERTRGIEKINVEQTEWYAPDIGLVKVQRREYTVPDKIRAEMVQELTEIKRI